MLPRYDGLTQTIPVQRSHRDSECNVERELTRRCPLVAVAAGLGVKAAARVHRPQGEERPLEDVAANHAVRRYHKRSNFRARRRHWPSRGGQAVHPEGHCTGRGDFLPQEARPGSGMPEAGSTQPQQRTVTSYDRRSNANLSVLQMLCSPDCRAKAERSLIAHALQDVLAATSWALLPEAPAAAENKLEDRKAEDPGACGESAFSAPAQKSALRN